MVVPLKDKKVLLLLVHFKVFYTVQKENQTKYRSKQNQDSESYSNSFKKWPGHNDIKMYSTYNEGKPVVAERFIRTLNNKIYKHMITLPKNILLDVLDDVVDKYNNTYYSTSKMKPIDLNSYAEFKVVSTEEDPKIQNKRTFLLKDMLQIGQKKFLLLVKLKILYHGLLLLVILMVKKYWNFLWKRIAKNKPRRIYKQKK